MAASDRVAEIAGCVRMCGGGRNGSSFQKQHDDLQQLTNGSDTKHNPKIRDYSTAIDGFRRGPFSRLLAEQAENGTLLRVPVVDAMPRRSQDGKSSGTIHRGVHNVFTSAVHPPPDVFGCSVRAQAGGREACQHDSPPRKQAPQPVMGRCRALRCRTLRIHNPDFRLCSTSGLRCFAVAVGWWRRSNKGYAPTSSRYAPVAR
jgi:hypothetical protein